MNADECRSLSVPLEAQLPFLTHSWLLEVYRKASAGETISVYLRLSAASAVQVLTSMAMSAAWTLCVRAPMEMKSTSASA